jgi:DNA-binding response OmpR family regulator
MATERLGSAAGGVVLVIDDEQALLGLVKAILHGAGFQVITARTGAEAQAHLTNFPVAVALVDLKLAHEDGGQVIADLRRLRPQLRIVAMSGDMEDTATLPSGADAAIAKPFTIQQLLASVNL